MLYVQNFVFHMHFNMQRKCFITVIMLSLHFHTIIATIVGMVCVVFHKNSYH